MKANITRKKIGIYLVIIPIGILFIFPYIFMVMTSFKSVQQVFEMPPRLIPDPFVFEWYKNLFESTSYFGLQYFNSVYIALVVSIGVCIVGSLGGYAFAKLNFRFKNLIFLLLLSSMMISRETILAPSYIIMTKLGWINTHLPLIIPPIIGSSGIFCLFLFRQFYLSIPDELINAAKIDGCTELNVYTRIILPLSKNQMVTVFLLTFLARWDNLIDPLIYLNDIKLYTLPLAISMMNMAKEDWTYQMAASVLATIPVIIVFLFSQKKLVKSITVTGIK